MCTMNNLTRLACCIVLASHNKAQTLCTLLCLLASVIYLWCFKRHWVTFTTFFSSFLSLAKTNFHTHIGVFLQSLQWWLAGLLAAVHYLRVRLSLSRFMAMLISPTTLASARCHIQFWGNLHGWYTCATADIPNHMQTHADTSNVSSSAWCTL